MQWRVIRKNFIKSRRDVHKSSWKFPRNVERSRIRRSEYRKRQKRLAIALPYARSSIYRPAELISKNGVILHLESTRGRKSERVGRGGGKGQEDFLDWNKVAVAHRLRRGGSFSGFVERRPIAGIVASLYHNGPIGMFSISFQHHRHPSTGSPTHNPSHSLFLSLFHPICGYIYI